MYLASHPKLENLATGLATHQPEAIQLVSKTYGLNQEFLTVLWPCTLQYFDRWACTPKISYEAKL